MEKNISTYLNHPKNCRATLLLRSRLGEEGRETACGLAKKAMHCGWIDVKQLVSCNWGTSWIHGFSETLPFHMDPCVKTNSTPSVHIKIAGIYGCSHEN